MPPPNINTPPKISIENTRLKTVDHSPYLGSHLSFKATIDEEVHHSCASKAYSELKKRVFEDRNLQSKTKICIYKAILLCYGSEAETTYSRHLRPSITGTYGESSG